MSWIIDMRHYLLPGGILAEGPAGRIARYFGSIVAAACSHPEGVWADTQVRCRRRPQRKPCSGHIQTLLQNDQDTVIWHCTSCDDDGQIRGWTGSVWDLSRSGTAWTG